MRYSRGATSSVVEVPLLPVVSTELNSLGLEFLGADQFVQDLTASHLQVLPRGALGNHCERTASDSQQSNIGSIHVSGECRLVRNVRGEYAPNGIIIQALIVVPGWYVVPYDKRAVDVLNEGQLGWYIRQIPVRYTQDQLRPIRRRLDEACRTLEF